MPAVEHTTELFVITGTFWHYRMRCRYRDDGSSVMVVSLWRAESRRVGVKIRLSVDKLRPLPAISGAVDDATIRRVLGVGLRPSAVFWARPFHSCLLLTALGFLGLAAVWRCGLVLRPLAARFSILPGGTASRIGCVSPPEGLGSSSEALQAPESLPVVSMENDYLYVKR